MNKGAVMPNHVFLAEVANHNGDASNVVSAILGRVAIYGAVEVEWYARPEQQTLLRGQPNVLVVTQTEDLAVRLKDRVQALSSNGAAGSIFHLFTWDNSLIGALGALNGPDLCVTGHHMMELLGKGNGNRPWSMERPRPPMVPTPSGVLSLTAAVEVAKTALRRQNHTSEFTPMRQPNLRHRMEEVDPRAKKNPYDPASVSLIKAVVQQGLREGWLGKDVRNGSEFIWLIESTSPASPPVAAQPRTTEVTVRVVEPVSSSQVEESAASATQATSKYRTSPSKQMEDILRKRQVGTHPRTRKYLFDAFRSVIGSSAGGMSVPKLRSDAADQAQQAAGADGHTEKDWKTASRCFLAMLLGSESLLDTAGSVIPRGHRAAASTAGDLKEDYRLRSNAFLIETLIRERGELREEESYSAGLAIFQTGSADPTPDYEIESQMGQIVELLLKDQRITFDGERFIPAAGGTTFGASA
jgi:hypothetical protein